MTEQTIFCSALEFDDPASRAAYLDTACGSDGGLRRRVEELLAAHERPGEFLDVPAVEQVAAAPADRDGTVTYHDAPGGDAAPPGTDPKPDAGEGDLEFLLPPAAPGLLGRLGHYDVSGVLGRGGFGIVLKAFDDQLHRTVAIKVLAPALAATSPARKRFIREARAAAAVRDEHLVQIYAVEERPLPHLVMEYVPGETLQQRIDKAGPIDVPEVLRIGRQVALGVAAAHARGLVHRDIKPANILLEDGPAGRVRLTDFGLARAADDASLTQSGMIAGTPLYMSPEQATGAAVDGRADLFSLGSVLYVMLTGRPPFRASTTMGVLKRVAEDTPRPIREIVPEVPAYLCGVVARLHAKQPADRFASADEVAALLGDCLARWHACGRVEPLAAPTRRPAGRRLRRLAPVGAVLLAAAAGYGLYARSDTPRTSAAAPPPDVPAPVSAPLPRTGFVDRVFKDADGTEHGYVVFVPRDYTGDRDVPAILFLHGAGEIRGRGNRPVDVGIGPAIRAREATFPFLTVIPQATGQSWQAGSPDAARALAIFDAVCRDYRVDRRRVYLTGISLGGFGTWSLAAADPKRWAAIAPVCGGGSPKDAARLAAVPCWCFHGDADTVNSVRWSRSMVAAQRAAGGDPRYTEYPGVGHTCWDQAYGTAELYEFFLAHAKAEPPP